MSNIRFIPALLLVALLWTGCRGTKNLPANEKLYTGASIKLEDSALTSREKKTLRSQLAGLTRPRPNSQILGMRIKLSIYNALRNKKENSFWGKLRSRYGEPPVLLSQVDLDQNNKVLQNFLENKGWFQARMSADTVVKTKTASAVYSASPGIQYKIRNVSFPADSSDLGRALAGTAATSLLKPGDPFDLDVIKAERIRIDALLKEQGFYFFNPDQLLIQTDSSNENQQVEMRLIVKRETPDSARQVYRINRVYIYSGYSLNTARIDTLLENSEPYKGFNIIDRRKRYKPKLFEESMQFRPGEVYNRTDHNMTLNRLINLNLFKFVKNRFEAARTDSPRLNAYYYLTPLPGKSLRAEITAISRSNNLNGSQINLSWLNRNLFRNGSQLNLSAYIGSDVQFSGALSGYNTYRTGAEAIYSVPRFLTPFIRIRPKGPYAPRTNLRIGYDILNRRQLYTLNSYRFEYGYSWKQNIQKSHELFPISIVYVQPLNVTRLYDSLEQELPGLARAIEPQFILGSRYEFLYNEQANGIQKRNSFFFNGILDLSGNIAGLLSGANVKKGDTVKIRNAPFSQYVKVQLDGRYYRKIGLNSTWANRIDVGIGIPYGNSTQVPYVKQFFVGGNNSLRGFRSRSVGPGVYVPVNSSATNNLIPDQTGDIKLELNTEFRPRITGPVYGAIFLDAGNIWLWNDSTHTEKPGAEFTKKFLSQMAVDAGVGIRLDITVFVIRLDVAFPLKKPWETEYNEIRLGNRPWRRANIVYNLAIGYPF
ncbi:MAG TPA: BamA/TamA family outer membrane protein [Flavisolibacter sp.]|nr:BamA/TamA family outer membrane protein [Flavisolibacter sp.]